MKKDIILFVTIFTILLLISGGTYAYWQWVSAENKIVGFNTSSSIKQYINYDPGWSHFVGDFQPSSDYCTGSIYNTVSFNKKDASEKMLVATLKMDVNSIGSSIRGSSNVHWVVTQGDVCGSQIATGTFFNVNAGTTLTLVTNLPVRSLSDSYTVHIWLDSNAGSSLTGQTLDVNIWTQIDQVAAWYGDVDLDGLVSANDVRYIKNMPVSGVGGYSLQAIKNADVNGDGEITDSDHLAADYLQKNQVVGSEESCKTPALPCSG